MHIVNAQTKHVEKIGIQKHMLKKKKRLQKYGTNVHANSFTKLRTKHIEKMEIQKW